MERNVRMLCFDMDGTLADFYNVPGWLNDLEMENPRPYLAARPLWPVDELAALLEKFIACGVDVRIITWLSRNSTESFKEVTRRAKLEWLETYGIPYNHFHGVAYGRTKADSVRKMLQNDEIAYLFDDNAKVCKGWTLGPAINPTETNIIEHLEKLLEVVKHGNK